jgi:pimeloyl-ACP methyl ester carboxylesterase
MRTLAVPAISLVACLVAAVPVIAQIDAVENVERRVVDVTSRRGLRQTLIVTRPKGTMRQLPAILFLPWMNCDSLAIPEGRRHGAQIILKHLVEQSGFVLGRIEKPGVGGSEGVCADIDFDTELAAYQAAFQHLETDPWVEPRGLIVAAQSFSGGIVPLVSQGRPVRGYLIMSTWVRTWFERLIEFERLRMLQTKLEPAAIAQRMRQYAELYAIYLNQRLTPGEVISRRPDLQAVWEGSGTHQYGRAAAFFHQLQSLNLEDEWSRVSAPTLALWGDRDIAMHRLDHERIVALVNANSPGAATLRVVPGAGHDLAVDGKVAADVLEAIESWLQRVASAVGPLVEMRSNAPDQSVR